MQGANNRIMPGIQCFAWNADGSLAAVCPTNQEIWIFETASSPDISKWTRVKVLKEPWFGHDLCPCVRSERTSFARVLRDVCGGWLSVQMPIKKTGGFGGFGGSWLGFHVTTTLDNSLSRSRSREEKIDKRIKEKMWRVERVERDRERESVA